MVIHALPASHGSKWLSVAYNAYFKKAPWAWIGMFVIMVILLMAPAALPLIGSVVGSVLQPVFTAGFIQGCRDLDEGRELKMETLFAGFKSRFSELVTLGVLNLLFSALAIVICVAVAFAGFGLNWKTLSSGSFAQDPSTMTTVIIAICVIAAIAATVFTVIAMAFWFAPALVYLDGRAPIEAIKESFEGCIRNIWPFTIFALVILGFGILAVIPLGLGLFVLLPVYSISVFTAYREIFDSKGF